MDFIPFLLLLIIFFITNENNVVSPASIPQMDNSQTAEYVTDSSERELESLKDRLDKTLEMVKTQSSEFSRSNGETQTFTDKEESVNQNGKLIASVQQKIESKTDRFNQRPMARIQTDVEIPSEGIHKSVVQEIAPERPKTEKKKVKENEEDNAENEFPVLPGLDYTPYDIAEYIFSTGDDKQISEAIEEFVNEGLINRQDAILFLEETKNDLNYLESLYSQMGLNLPSKYKANDGKNAKATSNFKIQRGHAIKNDFAPPQQILDIQRLKKVPRRIPNDEYSTIDEPKKNDYEQLLEKLKVADYLYTQYSLEDIIYQLAKIMFKQSLAKDNEEAQQALHKFVMFLENEAEQGHITRTLEKKVLDVLIAALTDTLTQNPDMINKAKDTSEQTFPEKQEVLRKILELNSQENLNAPTLKYSGTDKSNYEGQMKNNFKYSPMEYEKYSSSS